MSRSSHGAEPGMMRERPLAAIVGLLATGCLVLVGLSSAERRRRQAASKTTVVLGADRDRRPTPPAPTLPCQAVGSVTGFQVSNGQTQLPFRVPRDGKVKSWTLTLAQPTNSQRTFFNGFFGTPPRGAPGDPAPRRRAPTRRATTCAARARSTCSAPTSARRSSSAPT